MKYYLITSGYMSQIGLVIKGNPDGLFIIKVKNDIGIDEIPTARTVEISKQVYKRYKPRNAILLKFEEQINV